MRLNIPEFNKKKVIYGLNALLVVLALLLAYRILSPNYEKKENTSLNKMGVLHTQLAAERASNKLISLREELKDNGMRLVDPSRGPITLDSTRWLWLRIQDRDWRAPKFLEPLPAPNTEVDTWSVRVNKNSFVLSERMPIVKDGVQDYVLLEGGLRPTIFQDLQSEANFGFWLFDLKAYEKGGIGAAKIYEKGSSSGLLAKDEVKLLTSDLLMQLFQKQESVTLSSSLPWVVAFRGAGGPTRLGVLGYWLPETEAVQDLTTIWISLGIALLILSGLVSYFIVFTFKNFEQRVAQETEEEVSRMVSAAKKSEVISDQAPKIEKVELSSKLNTNIFNGLFDWLYTFAQQSKIPFSDLKDRVSAAYDISGKGGSPQLMEIKNLLRGCSSNLEQVDSFLGRFDSYFGASEGNIEIFDPEVYFMEFLQTESELPKLDTYFDPDIWRVRASKKELSYLLGAYIRFLTHDSKLDTKLHFSARFMSAESDTSNIIEIVKSEYFKTPFTRFHLQFLTKNPLGKTKMYDLFDFSKVKNANEMELALTQRVVVRMGARLMVKSNFEDGNVIILDLPAQEERKAEDKINAKQFSDIKGGTFANTNQFSLDANAKRKSEEPSIVESRTLVSSSGTSISQIKDSNKIPILSNEPKESVTEEKEPIRISDIEKSNSFAEGISDERSRVRSRFRIRKPGEKE